MRIRFLLLALAAALAGGIQAYACTNLLVGKKASADGSTFVTYNMDNYGMFIRLKVTPGGAHAPGELAEVWDYDNHRLLGTIPQVPYTHRVTGYINDNQLSIVETTWVGREGQENPDGIMHYTALMQLALERASNAREAIAVMTGLVAEYGYASSGETFSVADPDEVWMLEMIGKGADEKGAVWVAVRIPDDCIAAHANQSRIHSLLGHEEMLCSPDVISYARKKGFFSGEDADFDFCQAYSPTNFHMQRACEARVWSIFNRYRSDFGRYLATVDGFHLDDYEEMPLYVRPDRKVSLKDAMDTMRDHYEGTPLDMTVDMSGGPWHSPYRPRPQEYEIDGETYFHERPIASQQSACVMVCQMRRFLPDEVGGVLWFGNDDAAMVAYTPVYCCTSEAPACYDDPEASDVDFSWNSAFWVCNWVSNMVYPRFSVLYPTLLKVRDGLQEGYLEAQEDIEKQALALHGQERRDFLTGYGKRCAEEMFSAWKELGVHLIVMFNDMALKPEENGRFLTTPEGRGVAPLRNGYPDMYRDAIRTVTEDRYRKVE